MGNGGDLGVATPPFECKLGRCLYAAMRTKCLNGCQGSARTPLTPPAAPAARDWVSQKEMLEILKRDPSKRELPDCWKVISWLGQPREDGKAAPMKLLLTAANKIIKDEKETQGVVLDILMRQVSRRFETFDSKKGDLIGWLYRAVCRAAVAFVDRRVMLANLADVEESGSPMEFVSPIPVALPQSPEAIAMTRQHLAIVMGCIQEHSASETERLVILALMEGYAPKEIEERYGVSEDSVRHIKHRKFEKVRCCFEQKTGGTSEDGETT